MNEIGNIGDLVGVFMKYPKIYVVKDGLIGFMAPVTPFTQFESFEERKELVSKLKYFQSAS